MNGSSSQEERRWRAAATVVAAVSLTVLLLVVLKKESVMQLGQWIFDMAEYVSRELTPGVDDEHATLVHGDYKAFVSRFACYYFSILFFFVSQRSGLFESISSGLI